MARRHEEFLAELNGGRKSRGSGSQWQDQGDGRSNRITTEFAFAWDGKSTTTKGITVDRAMIAKIREQAAGERPQLGLRWYDTEDLQRVGEDWIAIPAADYAELLDAARLTAAEVGAAMTEVRARAAEAAQDLRRFEPPPPPGPVLRGPYPADRLPVPPHELWPCLVVDGQHEEAGGSAIAHRGYWIADDGFVGEYGVSSVRYDTGMGEMRLYVNDIRVTRGQLFVDGKLELTVGAPASGT